MAVRDELRALYNISRIDASARGLDDQIRGIPAELESRKQALAQLATLVERQRATIQAAEQLIVSTERTIAERNESLSKSRQKSAKAANTKEADSAEREVETIRKLIKDSELERERLQERIATTRASLSEPEALLAQQELELQDATGKAEMRLTDLRTERDKVVVGRDVLVKQVEARVVKSYERIRDKRGDGMAEVVGETCMGCRVRVPPPKYTQILKGAELYQCQMCNRFLFHKDAVAD